MDGLVGGLILRVSTWNFPDLYMRTSSMVRAVGSFWGGGSLRMWLCDVFLCNHRFVFLLSAPSPQPDVLVLLHAAYQPFGEWAEL